MTTPTQTTHSIEFTVDWGDCDPAGIVFYPTYFAWFDRGAHRLFESLGLDHHTVQDTYGAVGLSLVDAQASFKRPATFGDRICAEARIAHIGNSSLTLEHHLSVDGAPIVIGREVRVWMVREGAGVASARIPDSVRSLLETP